jgi:hypothetical protein
MAITTTEITSVQNVYDLTAKLYGNPSYVFKLINDNPTVLSGLNDSVYVGEVITYDTTVSATTTQIPNIVAPIVQQKQITIREQQNIFDLSVQLYGDASYIFKILQDNPIFDNINNAGLVGQHAKYDEQNLSITTYFKNNEIFITTGVLQDRQFDDSFSLSFL